jgi:hypothetical protein
LRSASLPLSIKLGPSGVPDTAQQQVHGRKARSAVDQLDAAHEPVAQVPALIRRQVFGVASRVRVRCEQKAARRRRRVHHRIRGTRLHNVDDRLNQRPRREVLPGAELDVFRDAGQ